MNSCSLTLTRTMKPQTLKSKEDFRQLMASLSDHEGPFEGTRLLIIGTLRNALREFLSCEAVVDNWPNFTAVVLKFSQQTKEILGNPHIIFGTDEKKLEELLCFPGTIAWNENFGIKALPVAHKQLIQRLTTQNGSRITNPENEDFVVTVYESKNRETPKLPSGYHASSLTEQDVPFVNQKWEYGGTPETERRIRFQITHMPTVGIFDKNGQIVSFGLGQYDNTTGMGFTLPERRGIGLGVIISNMLMKKVWQMNNINPLGFVRLSNDSMFRLLEKVGIQKLPDHVTFFRCVPISKISKI